MLARVAALFAAGAVLGTAAAAPWTASVDEREGLPALSSDGAGAMTSHFAFWGKNWAWSVPPTRFSVLGPFEYQASASNAALKFDLESRVRRPSARELAWELVLDARAASADVIGGGIAFHFDLAAFPELGLPELLPENRGWAWGRGARRVEMRFEPPLARVYFEPGKTSEIRGFFYAGSIAQGTLRHRAVLTGGADLEIAPTLSERFGIADHRLWPADLIDWSGPGVDLSFLNAPEKPAGRRGFVRAAGGKLQFGDGTPARFWGTNLSAAALFSTSREGVRVHARRLSALGFNLVRFHHHDSLWVNPNVFGDAAAPDTRTLERAMLERLDWWIAALKAEGIYAWLDLHVGRHLKAGDEIGAFAEIAKGAKSADLRGYNYVNPAIQQAMMRFNEAYLGHVNVHTGLRYADDPAIAAVLVTNENDVTGHFGNLLLPDKNVPWHNRQYMARASAFADRHGLPRDRTWRSWEQGPSKLFLNDLERLFNADMIRHLRGLGVRVPVATTNSWGTPLSSLPALTTGDVVDTHAYGRTGELDRSALRAPTLVHWIAAAQVAGKPLTASEWNIESHPAPDRHRAPLYVAAAASHQAWDALMLYAYGQAPLDGAGNASNWHAHNDPAMLAMLPAAALLYRAGHVREARKVFAFAPSGEQMFDLAISPATSPALRTAAELGRLVIAMPAVKELPWLEKSTLPAGATVLTDPARSLLPADAREAVSDTGELRRDWRDGVYSIDTPRTQAASGWIGGRIVALADVEIAGRTPNASVAVQSLDERPIARARSLLVSLSARALPRSGNALPFHSEPVEAELAIRARKGLRVRRLASPPGAKREIPFAYRDGRYLIRLDRDTRAHWLVLK